MKIFVALLAMLFESAMPEPAGATDILGCKPTNFANVRIVDSVDDCTSNEIPLSWSVSDKYQYTLTGLTCSASQVLAKTKTGWICGNPRAPINLECLEGSAPKFNGWTWFCKTPDKNENSRGITSANESSNIEKSDSSRERVPLETKDPRFANYFNGVKRAIDAKWNYPQLAVQYRLEGQLTIEFEILESGDLSGLRLVRSSGSSLLDNEAMRAIRLAAPFAAIPPQLERRTLQVTARMEYRHQSESNSPAR